MADRDGAEVSGSASAESTTLEFGGLRFNVSFREVGATLRVDGRVDGAWTEMLRFDDFVDAPHFMRQPMGTRSPLTEHHLVSRSCGT